MGQICRFIFGGLYCIGRIDRYLGHSSYGFHRMGSRMARKIAGGIGKKASFAAALFCLLIVSPRAEDVSTAPAPPPMSPPCDVPATDIAAPSDASQCDLGAAKGRENTHSRDRLFLDLGVWGFVEKPQLSLTTRRHPRTCLEGRRYCDHQSRRRRRSGGDTAERIKSEVALRKPDLVLWQLGTNDALARFPPQDFEQTVRSTLHWLKENQIDVVLVGVQYTSRLARDAKLYRDP